MLNLWVVLRGYYMDYDKIGSFILKLRNEKGWSQETLAEKVCVSRQAVSKWERGITLPDPNSLLVLKDIFKVSIDEILSGERFTKNKDTDLTDNVTIQMYTKYRKSKKTLKFLIIALLTFLVIFLIYFFINSYRSIQIFTIYGESDNIQVDDGIFVITSDKIYLSISNIISKSQEKIDTIDLYYLIDNKKTTIAKQDDNYLFIVDFKGSDNYFDTENIIDNLTNMYLDLTINGEVETIKLSFRKDYTNDMLIFKKKPKAASDEINEPLTPKPEYDDMIQKIKEKFRVQDDAYVYEFKDDKLGDYLVHYMEFADLLTLTKFEDEEIVAIWSLEFGFGNIAYASYINPLENYTTSNNVMSCTIEDCVLSFNRNKEFWKVINTILE